MELKNERDYTTYPRRFEGYKWYKPLAVGALFALFALIASLVIDLITKYVFGTSVNGEGYDGMDFYSAAGAFSNAAQASVVIPCLLFAAMIVKDRPISSYFSSMGGWRWKVFAKTFLAGLVLVGIPIAVSRFFQGSSGEIKFTVGGFIILTLLAPFQGVAEELLFRGYIMQTVSSWFGLPVLGLIVQLILFTVIHPYNIIGVANIAIAALMYALVCIYTKGLEAGSAMHIINNMTIIYLAGFGIGAITSEQTVRDVVFECGAKIMFFLFILYADKKLHWFDSANEKDPSS